MLGLGRQVFDMLWNMEDKMRDKSVSTSVTSKVLFLTTLFFMSVEKLVQ